MTGNDWKWLEIARNGEKLLEIAGRAGNGWKLLEMNGMAEMAGNDLND